jgi:large subunit ribosomal protein L25
MARTTSTKIDVSSRQPAHSRAIRRLRREGRIPGVLYGRGADPIAFDVDSRELRHALAATGAVLDVAIDGGSSEPAVVKDTQRHPVRGELVHVDLLRVDLNKPIHTTVSVTLVGAEDAPGLKEGGVLEQLAREVNIEALPSEIPETIEVDVSAMEMSASLMLADITAPSGVTLLDDPEATIIASIVIPAAVEAETDEVEAETEVVGEGEAPEAAADGEEAAADEAPAEDAGE